jgi:hypothetical protein
MVSLALDDVSWFRYPRCSSQGPLKTARDLQQDKVNFVEDCLLLSSYHPHVITCPS